MAVPKKRHSKSKARRRKMHIFLREKELVKCENCGQFKLPHLVCPFCGYYKGEKILEIQKEEKK